MSAAQLGVRLGISRQGVADIERREREGAVTLAALSRAAEALDCDLVYAIVPKIELSRVLEARARAIAEAEVNRVAHTMRLEDQETAAAEREQLVVDRAADLLTRNPKILWKPVLPSEGVRGTGTSRAEKHRGPAAD